MSGYRLARQNAKADSSGSNEGERQRRKSCGVIVVVSVAAADSQRLCKRIGRQQSSACTSYCASKRPPRSSNRYPPRSSSTKPPPRLGAICPAAWGGEGPSITALAGRVVLARQFDMFVNATPGPYAPGERRDAWALTVRGIVTPRVSVVPKVELAVSQDGVLMEYLTMSVVELTRNSKPAGENGPPRGPEKAMLLAGVTSNDG